MALFVMIGHDGPDGPALREAHHVSHVAHVEQLHRDGRILLAGPIKEDAGKQSIGAVIVFEADDLQAARRIVDEDPYVKAGVFASVTVQPFRQAFPPLAATRST